jgi:hypothetical protein
MSKQIYLGMALETKKILTKKFRENKIQLMVPPFQFSRPIFVSFHPLSKNLRVKCPT